eukprot:1092347-Prorocentrum_minimum.AAC.1
MGSEHFDTDGGARCEDDEAAEGGGEYGNGQAHKAPGVQAHVEVREGQEEHHHKLAPRTRQRVKCQAHKAPGVQAHV